MVNVRKSLVVATGLAFLSACGDPLASFEDVSDVTFAEAEPIAVVPVEAERTRTAGVFSRFLGQPEDSRPVPAQLPEEAPAQPENTPAPIEVAAAAPEPQPARSGGLLKWLAGQAPKPAPQPGQQLVAEPDKVGELTAPELEAKAPEVKAEVQLASLSPEEAAPEPKPKQKRPGLFASATKAPKARRGQ